MSYFFSLTPYWTLVATAGNLQEALNAGYQEKQLQKKIQ